MKFNIDVEGKTIGQLEDYVKNIAPEVIKESTRHAMNRTVATIKSRAIKGVASASNVKPQKFIRQRFSSFMAKPNRLVAGVTFRYPPIPAEVVVGKGGVKWSKDMPGAKAKGRTYIGAFTGTPHKGRHANKRKRIYRRVSRTGSNRSDLRAQYIHIEKYAPILKKVGERVVNQKLTSEFVRQFNFRMTKAGF